jgi:hypothetical protein
MSTEAWLAAGFGGIFVLLLFATAIWLIARERHHDAYQRTLGCCVTSAWRRHKPDYAGHRRLSVGATR